MAGRGTQLVGRRVELAQLASAADQAALGDAQLVVLMGAAGVGKTRCLETFLDRSREGGTVVLRGHCPPMSVGELPYAAIIDLLRCVTATSAAEQFHAALRRPDCTLAALVPDLGGAPAAGPLAVNVQPTGRLFTDLVSLFSAICQDHDLIVGIEDVHWSDRSTRDILGLVLRASAGLPLLTVLTCRSDELPPGDPALQWLSELHRAVPTQRLELAPFGRDEIAQLLNQLTGGPLQDTLLEQIMSRCAGNPFFAEELLAAHRSGTYGVPDTVRDMVLARLRLLPEKAQTLVRAAATIAGLSPTVEHNLLTMMLQIPAVDVVRLVREACAAHLLRPAGADVYSFRHTLVREAVESDVLPVEQSHWHRRAARTLADGSAGSEDPATLARIAHHWYAGGAATQALGAAVAAGISARYCHAYREAADLLERAVSLWPLVPDPAAAAGMDQPELLIQTAEMLMGGRDGSSEATVLADRALQLIDREKHPERAAKALLTIALADHIARGVDDRALRQCQVALQLLHQPSAERADAVAEYGRFLLIGGRVNEVCPIADEATSLGRAFNRPRAEGLGLLMQAVRQQAGGELKAAITFAQRVLAIATRIRDPELTHLAHCVLSDIYQWRGQLPAAAAELDANARAHSRYGVGLGIQGHVNAMQAEVLVPMGRFVEADAATSELPEGGVSIRVLPVLYRANLLIARGDFGGAAALLEELADDDSVPMLYAIKAITEAELALWLGRPQRARVVVASAIDNLATASREYAQVALCWLGLRAEADLADAADLSIVNDLHERVPTHEVDALNSALRQMAVAEHHRLLGEPGAAPWQSAIDAYDTMGARYLGLYPRIRTVEALLDLGERDAASALLRDVYAIAVTLGAGAVMDTAGTIARRAKIQITTTNSRTAALPLGLTARELDVLRFVMEGATNKQIANALWISVRTVDVHVSRVLAKLGVDRRTEAIVAAMRLGLFAHS